MFFAVFFLRSAFSYFCIYYLVGHPEMIVWYLGIAVQDAMEQLQMDKMWTRVEKKNAAHQQDDQKNIFPINSKWRIALYNDSHVVPSYSIDIRQA